MSSGVQTDFPGSPELHVPRGKEMLVLKALKKFTWLGLLKNKQE